MTARSAQLQSLLCNRSLLLWVLLPLLLLALHAPLLQQDAVGTHRWRQTLTLTMARAFHLEEAPTLLYPKTADRYMDDGVFLFEFPLLQAIMGGLYDVFGERVSVFRLLMYALSLGSVWGMYFWVKWYFGRARMALWAAFLLALCPLFFYYSWNPLPDMLALCLALWAVAFYAWFRNNPHPAWLLVMGVLAALTVLVKLPYILLLALPGLHSLLTAPWHRLRQQPQQLARHLLPAFVLVLAVIPAYYWYADNWYAQHKLLNVHIEAGFPSFGRLLYMLGDAFVSWIAYYLIGWLMLPFFLVGLVQVFRACRVGTPTQSQWLPLVIALALTTAYYIADIGVILNIHDYYLIPFLLTLPVITAAGIDHLHARIARYQPALIVLWAAYGSMVAYPMWYGDDLPTREVYVQREKLSALTPYEDNILVSSWDSSPTLMLYYLNKKGIAFPYHPFAPDSMASYIRTKVIRYHYSTLRSIDTLPEMQRFYARQLPTEGEFHVFELIQPD